MRKRMISIIACLTMLLVNVTSVVSTTVFADETEQLNIPSDAYVSPDNRTITNPRIVKDESMQAGQKVTWDCIWFGSYPQSEITSSDSMYSTLQNATDWDSNGDITLEGSKYRRIKKGDATYATSGDSSYYDWSNEDIYHYFIYEPIKWRVLKIEGEQAFLLSDIALDDQKYNQVYEEITWETSTIRSWLNGYGSSSNKQKIDYSSKNFINSAFTAGEKAEITDTTVINSDNINFETTGGNDTKDKVFFLSEAEVYGSNAAVHGFVSSGEIYDEARRLKSSTYAKAMGVYINRGIGYEGNCSWWLLSPGHYSKLAMSVNGIGCVHIGGDVNSGSVGVCVALKLNLSSNVWKDAGAVGLEEGETFFQITYNANGGSGAPEPQIKNSGVPLSLSSIKPVRTGYTFLGWSENSAATTADYKAEEEYSENDNVVLYAVWENDEPEEKIQVAYDANGGSGAPETQTKQPDAELILSDIKPTRPGYTFLGWSTDRSAESAAYEASGTYTDDRSTTLYAVWKANTYTITYANGGTETPSAQTKTHGQTLTLSSKVPVRQGYTFLGWSENNTATAPTYQAGGEYTENRDITLYAVWQKDESAVNPPSDPGTPKDDPLGNKTDKPPENVAKKVQKITTKASVFTKAYGSKTFSLGAKAGGGAKLTFKSSNSKVAKVSGLGKVTVKKYGTAKLTIRAEETKEYQSSARTVTVKVVPKAVSLKSVRSPYARKMEISWKRNKDASGYEVYLSKRKDFKKWTVKRSVNKSKSFYSISNCETKSIYYVKIRVYKKVGKTKYYGGWSKVKKVKIK